MFSYVASLVANGTSPWLMSYDPAAPFYGWGAFSAILGFLLLASFFCDFPHNPFGRIKFLLMLNAVNLLGYAASSIYLMSTGLRHSAEWVFIIWLIFIVGPFAWYFYEKYCCGDET